MSLIKVDEFDYFYNLDLVYDAQSYAYTTDSPIRTIWGFVKYKRTKRSTTHTYHAPINCNKVGAEVDINDTRIYTAMQLNLTPLEKAFS